MNYPLLDIFLSMMWFFLWMMWIFLVVSILMDVFRSDDMGGWAKAGWTILVIFLPLLGVLVYLIARGHSMRDRQMREAEAADAAFRSRVQEAAARHQPGRRAVQALRAARPRRAHGRRVRAAEEQDPDSLTAAPRDRLRGARARPRGPCPGTVVSRAVSRAPAAPWRAGCGI